MSLCNDKRAANDGRHRWDNIIIYCQLDEGHDGPHEFWTLTDAYTWRDRDMEPRRTTRA